MFSNNGYSFDICVSFYCGTNLESILSPDVLFDQGTNADQDARFADKKKKLMKSMKFADQLEKKVLLCHSDFEFARVCCVSYSCICM